MLARDEHRPTPPHASGQLASTSPAAAQPARPDAVKAGLTPKRPRRQVENDEYAAFVRRAICAYSRRIAAGDIDAITGMAALAADLDTAIHHAVTGLRRQVYSWADIAARLGITRQAAQQRWGGEIR
jgi:hypothetical protein